MNLVEFLAWLLANHTLSCIAKLFKPALQLLNACFLNIIEVGMHITIICNISPSATI